MEMAIIEFCYKRSTAKCTLANLDIERDCGLAHGGRPLTYNQVPRPLLSENFTLFQTERQLANLVLLSSILSNAVSVATCFCSVLTF